MSLEKLWLILFIKYVQKLDHVKTHLATSLKEFLLATSSTIDIIFQLTEDTTGLRNIPVLRKSLQRINALLDHSIKLLDSQSTEALDPTLLKDNIIASLVSTIDEEIGNLKAVDHPDPSLKIEALTTVRNVLRRHQSPREETIVAQHPLRFERVVNDRK